MKYQLLNPSPNFMEVVEEARSVVLAGGTMSPVRTSHCVVGAADLIRREQISDVINQLFSCLPSEKITSFSCGHIIPEGNLQTLVVSKGPSGGEMEFKSDKQGDPAVVSFVIHSVLANISDPLSRFRSLARFYLILQV